MCNLKNDQLSLVYEFQLENQNLNIIIHAIRAKFPVNGEISLKI